MCVGACAREIVCRQVNLVNGSVGMSPEGDLVTAIRGELMSIDAQRNCKQRRRRDPANHFEIGRYVVFER